ncbi:MAG: OmpA family protein, partial [Chitinivibrionales bacterium]
LQSSLIKVSKDARGTIISMSDILFETGKAALTPKLETNLAKIAGILAVFKNSNVLIEGHTDNTGSDEFNKVLSEKRAESVKEFMIEQGVAEKRLTAEGYGFSRPVADNSTKEGRAKNRRVDLIVQDIKPDKGAMEEDQSADTEEETVPEENSSSKEEVDESGAEKNEPEESTEKAKDLEAEEEDDFGDEGW